MYCVNTPFYNWWSNTSSSSFQICLGRSSLILDSDSVFPILSDSIQLEVKTMICFSDTSLLIAYLFKYLIVLTLPQERSASQVWRIFDVTLHAIKPSTFVHDKGFFFMRLCAQGGYLRTLTLRWLTQKLYVRNCDWFTIAIHDPIFRPKYVRTIKRPWSFKVRLRTESFCDSNKLYRTGFLFWVIELVILIFRVSNISK